MRLHLLFFTLLSIFTNINCGRSHYGTSTCSTELTYITNRFQNIDQAAKYQANLLVGEDKDEIAFVLDTNSSSMVVNGKEYEYGVSSVTGNKPYLIDSSVRNSMAINAADKFTSTCAVDVPVRFALTSRSSTMNNTLGVGYPNPQSRTHDRYNLSFLEQLVRTKKYKNEFSLALCGTQGNSHIIFGGIDDHMRGLIGNFIPIIDKNSYSIPAINIRLADSKEILAKFPSSNSKKTIIDSSSLFLQLEPKMANALAKKIQSEAESLNLSEYFPVGFFRTERANAIKTIKFQNLSQLRQFSSFEITFLGTDGQEKALELSPLHYFKEIDQANPLVRTLAIRETNNDIILGQPFLESNYTYFDRKNGRIGFANSQLACLPH